MSSVRTGWSSGRVVGAGILVALAGICYSSWVLAFLFPTPLDPLRTFLSELDAAHRPHREIYVVGDVLTAVFALIACALLVIPRPVTRGVPGLTAVISLGVFGAATLADVLSPIECIPHVDPGCPDQPNGLLPQLHHLHALTSTVAVFAIFTTMVSACLAAYLTGVWPMMRTAGASVLVIVALATVWMLVADGLSGDYVLGLAQRIQVGGMTLWLILWGVAIAGEPRDRAATGR
ncbi:DUF998 domain-containing protein [Gordonia sp. CPCC 206044]|uniref:DUF998 domain-containing protein n=1 Tax=Gordonia sp. CPCC 206044 TaxID=3140793 RepID=UPI003AF368A0